MVVYKVRSISNDVVSEVDVDVNEFKEGLVKELYEFIQTQLKNKEIIIKSKTLEFAGWSNLVRDNRHLSNEINLDIFLSTIDELMRLKDDVEFNKDLDFQLEMSKQNYLMVVFEHLNFVDKQTRQRIREVINRNMDLSIDEVAQENMDIALDLRTEGASSFVNLGKYAESQMQNIKTDVEKIRNSKDYITCYRGFNTRDNEDVRFSTNKNKSDYYKQREGMGFSFTMDKYIAFQFSGMFHLQFIKNADEKRKGFQGGALELEDSYQEILAKRKGLDLKELGRMTIGRYVIHKDDIMGYNNYGYEREIICDYRNAKLIDYKFMSDLEQESKDWDIEDSLKYYAKYDFTKLKNNSDSWINNNWKNDYRVEKSVESLF